MPNAFSLVGRGFTTLYSCITFHKYTGLHNVYLCECVYVSFNLVFSMPCKCKQIGRHINLTLSNML